jgi:hypothetical protein
MALIDIPIINPLRFIWQAEKLVSDSGTILYSAQNPAFHTVHFDANMFARSLEKYSEKESYIQPFQQCDNVQFMFFSTDSTLANFSVEILDSKGAVYTTCLLAKHTSTYNGQSLYYIYRAIGAAGTTKAPGVSLWNITEGHYFFRLKYTTGGLVHYFLSEPIHVKQIHQNTIRIDYRNSYNNQGVINEISTLFIIEYRVHGRMSEYKPVSKFNTYEDQVYSSRFVSGEVYRLFTLELGSKTKGVPNWVADKIDRLTLCDGLKVEGKEFTREANAQLDKKSTNVLSLYTMQIRERYNNLTNGYELRTHSLGDMPQTSVFWVETMFFNSTSYDIRLTFKGKRNFLDYLNSYIKESVGYFAESDTKKLVFISSGTLSGAWYISTILDYCVHLKYRTAGQITLRFDKGAIGSATHYAVDYGDTKVNRTAFTSVAPTYTTITKTWTGNGEREVFLFFSDAANVEKTGTNTVTPYEIGGDFPPSMKGFLYASGSIVKMRNNMFAYITEMTSFDINTNQLNTHEVDNILIFIYDYRSKFASSAVITLNGQLYVATPSSNSGMAMIISSIRSQITTLTTD